MRVNINGTWYDSSVLPIQIEITDKDKENIAKMHEEAQNYISFPNTMTWGDAKDILKIGKTEAV